MRLALLLAVTYFQAWQVMAMSYVIPTFHEAVRMEIGRAAEYYHSLERQFLQCKATSRLGANEEHIRTFDGCDLLKPEEHISADLKGFVMGLGDFMRYNPSEGSLELEKEFMSTIDAMLSVIRAQGRRWHWTLESPIYQNLVQIRDMWISPITVCGTVQATDSQERRSYMWIQEDKYSKEHWDRESGKVYEALLPAQLEGLMVQSQGVASLLNSTINEFANRPVVRLTLPEKMSTCQLGQRGVDPCRVVSPGPVVFRPVAAAQRCSMKPIYKEFFYPPAVSRHFTEDIRWIRLEGHWPVGQGQVTMEMA